MNFNLYKPSKKQFEITLMMGNKPMHYCDMLSEYELDDYENLNDFYIITHPLIYTIIGDLSILLPLGFITFEVMNNVYKENNVSYLLVYVDARCSFGKWPIIDYHLQSIAEMEKTKINIGETLNIFIESHTYKIANKYKINKVMLFNLATDDAVGYHTKNRWKPNAEKKLKKLINSTTGKNALQDADAAGFYSEGSNHMFKILNVES